LTSSDSGADVCSASFADSSYALAGNSPVGFGPVGAASTVMPARCSDSMNAVRAHAEGSSTL
jgi:hypothetical protein